MNAIVENMKSDKVLKRLTEVKRLAHLSEVKTFFNNCKAQFINIPQWEKMMFLGTTNKLSLFDIYGYEVNRLAQKGDYIKLDFHDENRFKNNVWFKIEELITQKEDEFEEQISMTLRESEDPKLKVNQLSISLAGKCELTLRRLIQTVSIDIKIHQGQEIYSENTALNFMHYFKWNMLTKNILSQL